MSAGRVARAVAVALSVGVAGCGSPATSPPSAAPTAEPPPVAAGTGLREVAVAELTVGEAPIDASGEPVQVTPGTLHEGDLVWVLRADDPDRGAHLVAAVVAMPDEATLPFGWVPAEVDGTPSLREAHLACPSPTTELEELARLRPLFALACFGPRPISFVGFTPIGCGAGGSPRTGTPEWLNGTWSGIGITNEEPQPPDFAVRDSIHAHAAPALDLEPCGSPGWYRFVGHFDDPASSTCRTETLTADGARPLAIDPLLSQLLCRTHLVLTEATPQETAP